MDSPCELESRLLAYMQAPGYEPQDASEIARGMGLHSPQHPALRALLREWSESGRLLRLRQSRYALKAVGDAPLTGRILQLPGGKLLFIPDAAGQAALRPRFADAGQLEFPVRSYHAMGAMDGDRVRASLRLAAQPGFRRRSRGKRPATGDMRPEVRVEAILERRRGNWVGSYRAIGRYGMMLGDGRSSPERVRLLTPPPPGLLAGMSIEVEAVSYPIGGNEATGRVCAVLGWPEDEGVGITTIIRKHGLRESFPPEVPDEVAALPDSLGDALHAGREDWREQTVVTIDPTDARDFDDAISVRACPSGGWELAVHIADVAHYVKPGSALDREARLRGNSTYLPDRVLPMLPPRLCDELCSLRAGEERLTALCLLRVDAKGRVRKAHFARALIRSRCRLDYATALAILEKRGSSGQAEVDAMLHEAHALATLLRQRRFEAGALDLDLPELRIQLDEHGRPTGVSTECSDIAHQLIEEFMLAANEAVARALREKLLPAIYRVHEEPDPGKLHEFSLLAASYGIHSGTLASGSDLQRVTAQIREMEAEHPGDAQALKMALLRSLMRARYDTKALGHYGLAKGDYCHFTSPIRRYADLVVHRAFARLCGGRGKLPPPEQLAETAEHISETERISAAAEQEARQLKLGEYVQILCAQNPPPRWQATVTAAVPQGLALSIAELQLKGFVPYTQLPANTHWFHERHAARWCSTDGSRLMPGSTLSVRPLEFDAESGFVTCRMEQD